MRIKIFADGLDLKQIKKLRGIDGYTFNPSLFRKLKVENYLNFSNKPSSSEFEIFSYYLRSNMDIKLFMIII